AVKQALRSDFEALAGSVDNLTHWALAESGESLNVAFGSAVSEEQVQAILSKHQLEVKSIDKGEREDKPEFMVYLVSLADKIEQSLMTALEIPATENIVKRVEFVGPQVGAELRNQGIMAIIYALGFILLYIAIRFDFAFAPGAIVALVHDVLITVGVFAIFQLEFNLPIIAAILALVGYSLNDTIVVYDRIRENGLRLRGRGLRDLVNTSINQTLSRTLLTSGTTLMVVIALMVFGGGIIKDFSIALCIGVIVGTYSSVYVASPVYIALRERSEDAGAPSNTKKKRTVSSAA
ncbi:MAG: protein translocase subunit SecF, partial [Myxococcota bacterium]|nr:protein translocase subunit SecF [Myxococcota bacterium]